MKTETLLKELSEISGLAGREDAVRRHLQALWEPWVDELRTDALGNLIGVQRGATAAPRPELMLAAHMDEIGLVVTEIEKGFLHVGRVGGVDLRVLLGLRVTVHGRRALPGVIGTRPPHVLSAEERKKVVPWEKLFVDLGLPAEEVQDVVGVGDPVSIHRPLLTLQNRRVAGKALDNRASVAALTQALEMLRAIRHDWDVYAVATVQEEVGIKGAITGAYGVAPQLAVALDVTFAKQAGDSEAGAFALDKGPTVGVGPNFHPQVVERLREAAKSREIPYQVEVLPGSSGTDAWGIQVAREGVPTGLLSIPVRYMHQPVEMVALGDIERTARLLAAFVADLPGDYTPRWEDEL
ncbi:MAG: M42 family metallopeptidase [Anaerolineae bacterium]